MQNLFEYLVNDICEQKFLQEEAVLNIEAILRSEKLRVDRIEDIEVGNEEELVHEFLLSDKKMQNKEELI